MLDAMSEEENDITKLNPKQIKEIVNSPNRFEELFKCLLYNVKFDDEDFKKLLSRQAEISKKIGDLKVDQYRKALEYIRQPGHILNRIFMALNPRMFEETGLITKAFNFLNTVDTRKQRIMTFNGRSKADRFIVTEQFFALIRTSCAPQSRAGITSHNNEHALELLSRSDLAGRNVSHAVLVFGDPALTCEYLGLIEYCMTNSGDNLKNILTLLNVTNASTFPANHYIYSGHISVIGNYFRLTKKLVTLGRAVGLGYELANNLLHHLIDVINKSGRYRADGQEVNFVNVVFTHNRESPLLEQLVSDYLELITELLEQVATKNEPQQLELVLDLIEKNNNFFIYDLVINIGSPKLANQFLTFVRRLSQLAIPLVNHGDSYPAARVINKLGEMLQSARKTELKRLITPTDTSYENAVFYSQFDEDGRRIVYDIKLKKRSELKKFLMRISPSPKSSKLIEVLREHLAQTSALASLQKLCAEVQGDEQTPTRFFGDILNMDDELALSYLEDYLKIFMRLIFLDAQPDNYNASIPLLADILLTHVNSRLRPIGLAFVRSPARASAFFELIESLITGTVAISSPDRLSFDTKILSIVEATALYVDAAKKTMFDYAFDCAEDPKGSRSAAESYLNIVAYLQDRPKLELEPQRVAKLLSLRAGHRSSLSVAISGTDIVEKYSSCVSRILLVGKKRRDYEGFNEMLSSVAMEDCVGLAKLHEDFFKYVNNKKHILAACSLFDLALENKHRLNVIFRGVIGVIDLRNRKYQQYIRELRGILTYYDKFNNADWSSEEDKRAAIATTIKFINNVANDALLTKKHKFDLLTLVNAEIKADGIALSNVVIAAKDKQLTNVYLQILLPYENQEIPGRKIFRLLFAKDKNGNTLAHTANECGEFQLYLKFLEQVLGRLVTTPKRITVGELQAFLDIKNNNGVAIKDMLNWNKGIDSKSTGMYFVLYLLFYGQVLSEDDVIVLKRSCDAIFETILEWFGEDTVVKFLKKIIFQKDSSISKVFNVNGEPLTEIALKVFATAKSCGIEIPRGLYNEGSGMGFILGKIKHFKLFREPRAKTTSGDLDVLIMHDVQDAQDTSDTRNMHEMREMREMRSTTGPGKSG